MSQEELDQALSEDGQFAAAAHIFEYSIESILHDVLLQVHREEKLARMQTAVVELNMRAEKLGHSIAKPGDSDVPMNDEPLETKAAIAQGGQVHLRGNPMKNVKHIRCPRCRLPKLLYPRVGFNAKPPPDGNVQYCKSEPMIIIDKHDVHGQRKKGVKVKGQPKGKGKKDKLRESSPASSLGDPQTPSSAMPDSFEFKEIDYPAAKCPNRNSHLGDHWKAVNLFATHLNGSCWLKRDRAAMREATAKMSGTPKDSRASSPKPAAATTNGVKRKATDDRDSDPVVKKKQKINDKSKPDKKAGSQPSKLREQSVVGDDADNASIKTENDDTIQVALKSSTDAVTESAGKIKISTSGLAKNKLAKSSKKS